MKSIIHKLKLASIAYKAAIEFDSCPYDDEIEDVVKQIDLNDDYNNTLSALKMYGGNSLNDIESKIIKLIDILPYEN